jgi:4-hydroxybenzoate polyprenyltransferase
VKNLVVFAGLIFGLRLRHPASVALSVAAFVVFCGLSSTVYLLNDVLDREADRRHPVKSLRPIAAGTIGVGAALLTAAALTGTVLTAAFLIAPAFGLVAAAYLLLMTLYSAGLKHRVILDALAIASGFVMRALGGAMVIGVPFSQWLLILTLLLALFLVLNKRRAELTELADGATGHRPALADYNPALLDQMIATIAASTLLAYAVCTMSPETVARLGTNHLLFTLPFPLYGIFRYLYLAYQRAEGGNPSEQLFSDRPLLACVGLWALTVIPILYGPWR